MPHLLRYGVVGRAHGLHGSVRIHPHSQDLSTAEQLTELWIGSSAELAVPYRVRELRAFKKAFLADLEGVTSVDRADRLSGQAVWVDRSLFDSEPGWYLDELKGARVVQQRDSVMESIGTLVGFADSGGPVLMEISRGNRIIFIPWVDPFVAGVRDNGKTVVLTADAPVDL